MPVDNLNLVPWPDMLGLPMPPWLAQALMALTLALHWSFLAMTAGGAVAYLAAGRAAGGPGPMRRGLAAFLPFSLMMAVTMGVAPLLFVQVLYGPFFYTSNILMGYVWLGLLPLVIAALYLLYGGWRRTHAGRGARGVGAAVLVLMAAAAVILSANATLTQNPGAWTGFRAAAGLRPYLGGATFWPRWAAALGGLAGGGGLFVAALAHVCDRRGDASARVEVRRALAVAAVGLAVLLAGGMWAGLALSPAVLRAAVLSGPESVFAYAAMAAVWAALLLVLVAIRRPALWNLVPACGLTFLGALALAAARDTARRAALALGDCYHLSDVPVHPQWTSFGLFAVVFVLGLALVAYMVRMARRSTAGSGKVL